MHVYKSKPGRGGGARDVVGGLRGGGRPGLGERGNERSASARVTVDCGNWPAVERGRRTVAHFTITGILSSPDRCC